MTRVLAKYKSKVISRHPIQKFMVKIDNCKVELESRQQELIIQISGKAGEEKTKKLLSDLENLLFFYLGSFPFMESLNINDADEPLKSNTYKIEKQWKKFIREIEELQKEALNNENSQDVEIPE